MSDEDFTNIPRNPRKPVSIRRVEVCYGEDVVGEAWAAIDEMNELVSVGADIKAVTDAAFYSGHRIAPQVAR